MSWREWFGAALLALPCAGAASADDTLRVTCRQASKVVFVGDVARADVGRTTSSVLVDFPSALCVSLGAETPDPPGAAMPPFASGPVDSLPLSTGATGLDTALRALRGDPIVVAPAAPPAPPAPVAPRVEYRAVNYGALAPSAPGWARLAVYSQGTADDALSEWERVVAADPLSFADMTPDIVEGEGYVMLSAGPVAGSERGAFCLAAASEGLDCRFAAGTPDGDGPSMDAFLAYAGATPAREESPRRDAWETEAEGLAPGSVAAGQACWPSRLALDASAAASVASPPAVAQRTATEAPAPTPAAARRNPRQGRERARGRVAGR